MAGYGAETFGESMADVYDRWYRFPDDIASSVGRLLEWARGGSVLELGIGTGRIAIPLANEGLDVWGVDASPAMLNRLREEEGSDLVHAVLTDMARLDLPSAPQFSLVYAVFHTFFNLVSEKAQQECLAAVHRHLSSDGRLVIEAFVPSTEGAIESVEIWRLELDKVVLSVSRDDRDQQTVMGQAIEIAERGIRLRPWKIRYLWPHQLDGIASEAGFSLEGRWSGWDYEPFDESSRIHVSLYRRS